MPFFIFFNKMVEELINEDEALINAEKIIEDVKLDKSYIACDNDINEGLSSKYYLIKNSEVRTELLVLINTTSTLLYSLYESPITSLDGEFIPSIPTDLNNSEPSPVIVYKNTEVPNEGNYRFKNLITPYNKGFTMPFVLVPNNNYIIKIKPLDQSCRFSINIVSKG